jgi:flagellar FliJ protein
MKKFQFTLEKLLEYKNTLLDEGKNGLAYMRLERNQLQDQVDLLESQVKKVHQKIQVETKQGTTISKLRGYQYQIENAHYQIKLLLIEIKKLESRIEKQLQVVILLSQEAAGLEKLEEKQLEDYRQAVAKADELVVAEHVSSKYIRQQSTL